MHARMEELEDLFWGQCVGDFFTGELLKDELLYGGTLIGYATAFSLERAITTMLVHSCE